MTDSAVKYDRDADGVVTLTLDDPQSSANTMNERYKDGMHAAVERLVAEKDEVRGVVVASAKKTFFAGGDLKGMVTTTREDAESVFREVEQVKADLRRLETLGKPVVAAINGAALGGGLEIALACHHRIAVDGRYEIGLPEATLGLLPGGGGVTRTVRMFGIQTALMDVLLQGPRMKPAEAKEKGLVDELVASRDELLPGRDAPGCAPTPTTSRRRPTRGTARATGCPAARPAAPSSRRSCPRSRRCCASRSRAPTTPRSARSCRRPSRAPRSTSTPPAGSSRATSPS